jgi:sulfatase modifying factor 1
VRGALGLALGCVLGVENGAMKRVGVLLVWALGLGALHSEEISAEQIARKSKKAGQSAAEWEGRVGQVVVIQISKGVRMRLCYCPSGEFMMGSPVGEEERLQDEGPVGVKITHGFWMAETEFTQRQWAAVMGVAECGFTGEDRPMESVTWQGAQEMIGRLNGKARVPEGWRFALPTEAQWEYACRAGTLSAYAFGDALSKKDANFDQLVGGETVQAGSYRPNPWGLYDMHGNVWEWCADWYRERLSGGVDPKGPSSGEERVRRGGAWFHDVYCCRSAFRGSSDPEDLCSHLGVRVVLVSVGR